MVGQSDQLDLGSTLGPESDDLIKVWLSDHGLTIGPSDQIRTVGPQSDDQTKVGQLDQGQTV